MRSRFITHYFLAQGKGNNVCCKRAITVIFRTVVLNCKFQSISYFLHYFYYPYVHFFWGQVHLLL